MKVRLSSGLLIATMWMAMGASSPASASASASTSSDTTAPTVPIGLRLLNQAGRSVEFAWSASSDNVGVTGYDGVATSGGSVVAGNFQWSGTTATFNAWSSFGANLSIRVRARDAAGNWSDYSSPLDIASDSEAPSQPQRLRSENNTATQINLKWDASTDNVGVAGYLVYRDGTQIGTPSSPGYTVTGLAPGTPYTFKVRARDAADNVSALAEHIAATAPPADASRSTLAMIVDNADANGTAANTVRLRVKDTNGNPMGGVLATLNAVSGITFTPASHQCITVASGWCDIALRSTRAGSYPLTAKIGSDTFGSGITATFNSPSPVADAARSTLAMVVNNAEANGTAANTVRLLVKDINGNPMGGVLATLNAVNGITFTPANRQCTTVASGWCDIALRSMQAGTYPLTAKLGGASFGSGASATFKQRDTTPPTAPRSLRTENNTPTRINLKWDASTDNVGVAGYEVQIGAAAPSMTTETSRSFTGLSPGYTYKFRVRATDAAGNWSYVSEHSAKAQYTDATPPTAPTNLSVVSREGRTATLAWNESTDNVGVTGYRVQYFQNGFAPRSWSPIVVTSPGVGTTTVPPNASTIAQRWINIQAQDEAGNWSAVSNSVSFPGPDGPSLVPPVPTGLTATNLGSGNVRLSWNAAPGATEYSILVSPGPTYRQAATSLTLNGLQQGATYYFLVYSMNQHGSSDPAGTQITVPRTGTGAESDKRLIGYFTQWGDVDRNYTIKDLDISGAAARLTHLQYAYGKVENNRCQVGDAQANYGQRLTAEQSVDDVADSYGRQPLAGHWHQLRKLKAQYPHLRVLISLGGRDSAAAFAEAAQPEQRQAFVASCIDLFVRGHLPDLHDAGGPGAAADLFDGLNLAWEQPDAVDEDNYAALVAELRRQLDAERPGLLLATTVGAQSQAVAATVPAQYQVHVDFVNLAGYDLQGLRTNEVNGAAQWTTQHHAPLFAAENAPNAENNLNDAVLTLLENGLPADKLNLGIGLIGRGWQGVPSVGHGLGQLAASPATDGVEPGVASYKTLKALAWPSHHDADAQAHWVYDRNVFWSYDDAVTIQAKLLFLQAHELGGAMLWNLGGDDQGELLELVSRELAP